MRGSMQNVIIRFYKYVAPRLLRCGYELVSGETIEATDDGVIRSHVSGRFP